MSTSTLSSIPPLIRHLAADGERLTVNIAGHRPQQVVILPDTLSDRGFTAVTLLSLPPSIVMQRPGIPVYLSGRLRAAPIRFASRLQAWSRRDDEWLLHLDWPDDVDYQQRRRAHRVPVPSQHPCRHAVLISAQAPLPATVVDISRIGIGLELGGSALLLPTEETLFICEAGSGLNRFRLRFEAGYRRQVRHQLYFGGTVTPLADCDEPPLSRAITELERLWLQHRQIQRADSPRLQ